MVVKAPKLLVVSYTQFSQTTITYDAYGTWAVVFAITSLSRTVFTRWNKSTKLQSMLRSLVVVILPSFAIFAHYPFSYSIDAAAAAAADSSREQTKMK